MIDISRACATGSPPRIVIKDVSTNKMWDATEFNQDRELALVAIQYYLTTKTSENGCSDDNIRYWRYDPS